MADTDIWSDWLLRRRHAGNPELGAAVAAQVGDYVDAVLDAAGLGPGMVLLDVGAGDGAVALRAIERVGAGLSVILADPSAPLLRRAAERAEAQGVREACRFIQAPAERLADVPAASVDAVTTRAVLAYVADKAAAFAEFFRVLKPGGRLSIAEPLFRRDALAAAALRVALETRPAAHDEPVLPLVHRWKAAQFPDTAAAIAANPMTNFDEADLARLARAAGFEDVAVSVRSHEGAAVLAWEAFLQRAPHPLAPSLADVMTGFSSAECDALEAALRPQIEAGRWLRRDRVAYLTATVG
jgi:ubiquinone/menaquinone biosynthesis C-methylase UbiE